MKNIISIWKVSFTALLLAVFCVATTKVVDAKTVTTSNSFISQDAFIYFTDVYKREDYKYSLVASEHIYNSAYNYVNYYYVCLTNEEVNVTNSTNASATCEKLLRYSRNDNSYTATVLSDSELKVQDTLYYYLDNKDYFIPTHLFIISILTSISLLLIIFMAIFRS